MRRNIESTKSTTIPINRPKNTSLDIYEVLYIITLPAIKLTTLRKNRDM
jgi:hypothetical protein